MITLFLDRLYDALLDLGWSSDKAGDFIDFLRGDDYASLCDGY